MILLTRTKIRNSTNPTRSRTSPNVAMTPGVYPARRALVLAGALSDGATYGDVAPG